MVSIATLAYSIAAPIVRWAILDGMNPTTLLMVRMVMTTALLGGSLAIFAPSKLKIDRRGFWIAILAGAVNGTGFLTFFWSLKRLDASISAMLFSLAPLVILGMLALRGEKLTYRHLVRLGLGLAGVYLLIGPGGDVDLMGALLVGLGIITFSFQLVMLQWYLKDYDGWTITFYILTAIMVDVVIWWLIQGREWHDPGVRGWTAIFILAIVSTFLARLAMFASVRYIGSGQTALFMPLETLLTVIWSIMFLNEKLSLLQWVGGGLILASVVLAVQRLRFTKARFRWRRSTRI
ncbi:MAG TPA: DMT family transporter [Anaerolineales bacterium]|nr:DMT family transporter [Anaerolineales bacterium]